MEKLKEKAVAASARSNMYGFLAMVYRKEPEEELLRLLDQPDIRAAFSDSGFELPKIADRPVTEVLEELAVEYTRLFLGPGPHVSPHESVFSGPRGSRGSLWGPETVKVKQFMEACGLQLPESSPLIPDHVSVELEFMQWLCKREAEVRKGEDSEGLRECLRGERKFLEEHLGKWFPGFAEAVKEAEANALYLQVTIMARDFIEQELEDLEQVAPENFVP